MWLRLLCDSTSKACGLGYHEVWIKASPFIQAVKEPLMYNYFKIDTNYISPYLLLRLCGVVFLLPPPWEPVGSLHPLFPCTQLIYRPPHDVLCNVCLTHPHLLPHHLYPCHIQHRFHQGPLPFPIFTPLQCHPGNSSCNNMVENFQDHQNRTRNHPSFATIQ